MESILGLEMLENSLYSKVETIARRSRIGDWFLLYQLGKNIDPLIFREFVGDLYKKMEIKQRDSFS